MEKSSHHVRVCCRFRPINEKEKKLNVNQEIPVSFPDKKSVVIYHPGNENAREKNGVDKIIGSNQKKKYIFDHVFPGLSSQKEVYRFTGEPMIQEIIRGYNCTIFTYGQTSSGKTHSMFGFDLESGETGVWKNENEMGIIPRAISDLFECIDNVEDEIEFTLKVSFLEIYLEKIKDLICPQSENLKIRETENGIIYVENAKEVYVSSFEEILAQIRKGQKNRAVAETKMNRCSSRSHSVLTIKIIKNNLTKHTKTCSKLTMVDLAGSERIDKSGAEGLTLTQVKHINKSLLMLGNVIHAITDKEKYIPYRDSKLTRLLQDSLGGNSKTCLLVTCSPSWYNLQETISTLQFGTRAKKIKNKPRVNKELTIEDYKKIVAEKDQLIEYLKKKANQAPISSDLVVEKEKIQEINEEKERILKKIKEQYEEELKEKDLDILSLEEKNAQHLSELNKKKIEIDAYKEKQQEQEEKINDIEAEKRKKDMELLKRKNDLVQLEEELEETKKKIDDLLFEKEKEIVSEAEKQKQQKKLMEEQKNYIESILQAIESEKEKSKKNYESKKESEKKVTELKKEIKKQNEEIKNLKKEIETLHGLKKSQEAVTLEMSQEIEEYSSEIKECQNQIDRYDTKIENYQEKQKQQEAKTREYETEIKTKEEIISEKERMIEELTDQLKRIQEDAKKKLDEKIILQENLEKIYQKHAEASVINRKLKKEISDLRQSEKKLEKECENLRFEIRKINEDHLALQVKNSKYIPETNANEKKIGNLKGDPKVLQTYLDIDLLNNHLEEARQERDYFEKEKEHLSDQIKRLRYKNANLIKKLGHSNHDDNGLDLSVSDGEISEAFSNLSSNMNYETKKEINTLRKSLRKMREYNLYIRGRERYYLQIIKNRKEHIDALESSLQEAGKIFLTKEQEYIQTIEDYQNENKKLKFALKEMGVPESVFQTSKKKSNIIKPLLKKKKETKT
jgi:kinesin family protein 5